MNILELSNKAQKIGLYLTVDNGDKVKLVKIKADDWRYKNDMRDLSICDAAIIINTLHNALIK